jgi:hypothetical protein
MNTLFLAWQDSRTRAWYPIGRLDADANMPRYKFKYVKGVQRSGMRPLESLPDFKKVYESADLFPLFQNRVLAADREDFKDYLLLLDMKPEQANPLEILAITGGYRQTDNFEVFPKIDRSTDGRFKCRFFLHGWRHVNEDSKKMLDTLKSGEELKVAIELNNPATGLAIQLMTQDYHMIGWSPRYLVIDLVRAINPDFSEIQARVVKVNPSSAPSNQRVLIELSGNWPDNYDPMSSEEYQDIT